MSNDSNHDDSQTDEFIDEVVESYYEFDDHDRPVRGECLNGMKWKFDWDHKILEITGEGMFSPPALEDWSPWFELPATEVRLPENTKSIDMYAFTGLVSVKKIFIPKNVEMIHAGAFDMCPNLQSINVDPSNNHFVSIDGVLFIREPLILWRVPEGRTKRFELPKGTKGIYHYALNECEDLEALDNPDDCPILDYYDIGDWGSSTEL